MGYLEVRNNYTNTDENKRYIDAWVMPDENEEGRTIAKIDITTHAVEYLDLEALSDPLAQNIIKETLIELKSKPQIKVYSIRPSESAWYGRSIVAAETAEEANFFIQKFKDEAKNTNDNGPNGYAFVHEYDDIPGVTSENKGILLKGIFYVGNTHPLDY